MTIKDQNGKKIFNRREEYSVNDLYFKGGKKVPMAEWDVTATEHFGLGIEPLTPKIYTFIVPVNLEATSVTADAVLTYEYSRDRTFTVGEATQKVVMEQ